MHVHEEYIKRHKLNVPLIKYPEFVSVILKKEFSWQILTCEWHEATTHPGKYHFRWLKPIYNSCMDREWFEDVLIIEPMYWDEYEAFVNYWLKTLRFMESPSFQAATTPIEIALATWEMFLFVHDDWIAFNIKQNKFYDLVYESTNSSKDTYDRYQSYTEASDMIENGMLEDFQFRVSSYIWNYSDWLADLLNNETTTNKN